MAGKTKVIVGTMFSGKTTLLQNLFEAYGRVDKFTPFAFKPVRDTRGKKGVILSHDKNYIYADMVGHSSEILDHFRTRRDNGSLGKAIYFIDEIQFMDQGILEVIDYLNKEGADVVCSGLNLDRFGKPFGIMPQVMAIADEIVHLKAICNCGNEAYVSYGKNVSSSEQVAIGGKQEYEPLCKECFYTMQSI